MSKATYGWRITKKDGSIQLIGDCEHTVDETGAAIFRTEPPISIPNGDWTLVEQYALPIAAATSPAPERTPEGKAGAKKE